jgi:hypothetical protein
MYKSQWATASQKPELGRNAYDEIHRGIRDAL